MIELPSKHVGAKYRILFSEQLFFLNDLYFLAYVLFYRNVEAAAQMEIDLQSTVSIFFQSFMKFSKNIRF